MYSVGQDKLIPEIWSKSGVPPNSVLFGGTVPPNSLLFGGTVPPNSVLFCGTVPPNSVLFGGTVSPFLLVCNKKTFSIPKIDQVFSKSLKGGREIVVIHLESRGKLFGGTVPPNNTLFGGTVPPNSTLFGGTPDFE